MFRVRDYLVKGVKAGGVRLANKEMKSGKFVKDKDDVGEDEEILLL